MSNVYRWCFLFESKQQAKRSVACTVLSLDQQRPCGFSILLHPHRDRSQNASQWGTRTFIWHEQEKPVQLWWIIKWSRRRLEQSLSHVHLLIDNVWLTLCICRTLMWEALFFNQFNYGECSQIEACCQEALRETADVSCSSKSSTMISWIIWWIINQKRRGKTAAWSCMW